MMAAAGVAWSIPASERIKYDQIFDGLQPLGGLLSGDKVRPVLLNSNLPLDVLSRVWELSDIDGDGMLDREEFTVAMHLVYRALEKIPVPATIPPEMVPPSKRRSGATLPGAIPVLPGAVQVLPNTVSGMPSAMPVVPTTPPAVGPLPGNLATRWVVSPVEKLKYDEMFRQADTDMDGYVNGAEIKDIFLQSGLPQLVLAHIWNLCDTGMMGKLNSDQFALAMYLVQQKLIGIEPPAQLLPEMVPPSLRSGVHASGGPLPITTTVDSKGLKELDILSKEIEDLKQEKAKLEQDKAQKEADIKIKNGEVMTIQKELDALSNTVKQLELQKGEAQKRLDDLDDKRSKLEATVLELKEKYQEEQQQIKDLRYQITNRESIVNNQQVELRKMRDDLGSLRQKEADLEQQVDASQKQAEQMSKKLKETQTEIDQTNVNIKKLLEAKMTMDSSIKQYDALLKNEITEDQLTEVEPVKINLTALSSASRSSASPSVGTTGGTSFVDEFKQDSSGSKDPFANSSAGTDDPFHNEDPFANISSDGMFQGSDAFVEGSDPFGSDPFKDAFAGSSNIDRPSSAFGAGASGFASGSFLSSQKASTASESGGDPWGAAFPPSGASGFDNFDPFGNSSLGDKKAQLNFSDPFGTGSFDPPSVTSKTSARSASQSPTAPVLPPKQKKAPAPPRPPAPKPAAGSLQPSGRLDAFDLADPFEGGLGSRSGASPASLTVKNNLDTNFARFSPAKFSSEEEQWAWAKRDSEQEFERLRRLRAQEEADLEFAIALSKQESAGTYKS